ncbi:hypothetical protein ACWEQL_35715 [Kitasatospora sp. NPDC004240]
MICPHCEASLLQRQRTDRRCGMCHKEFALDPKVHGPGMNDLRLRRVVTRLTADGTLAVTTDQLYWALQRRGLPEPGFKGSRISGGCLTWLGVIGMGVAFWLWNPLAVAIALVGVVLWGFAVREFRLSSVPRPMPVKVEPSSAHAFRVSVVDGWKRVYRGLPPGVREQDGVKPAQPVGRPALAVLCQDPTVRAFLHANDFPRRHRALLVRQWAEAPAGVPIVVLHDASPQGQVLVLDTRAARPGRRVVDAGLPVRVVVGSERRFVILRAAAPSPELRARLERSAGLTPAELAWYADGWWSPLAALPPAKLLAAVTHAAERATAPASLVKQRRPEESEETRRRAEAVGFLSWPEAPEGAR